MPLPVAVKPGSIFTALKPMLWSIALIFFSFYAAGCVGLYFVQDSMLFPGTRITPIPTPELPPGSVVLKREIAPSQTVEAWYFPALGASQDHPAPLVVFFHGNAECIDYAEDIVIRYNAMGWSVLLPEYRGYNRSAGKPSQAAIHEDAAYFLKQTLARPEVDATRVVFHGRSLGGGVACDLTRAHMPQGLILTSTFISVVEIAKGYLAPAFLVKHPFRNDLVVASYGGPILISHGAMDTIIPMRHSQTLAQLARHATFNQYPADHNDFPGGPQAEAKYWATIRMFLANIKPGTPAN